MGQMRCVVRTSLFTMAGSAKSASSKSAIISSKAASLKKTVQKGAKAVAQPFKKLKRTLSIRSAASATRSTTSRSSTVLPPSINEVEDSDEKSDADSGSPHSSNSETELELTPEQEL